MRYFWIPVLFIFSNLQADISLVSQTVVQNQTSETGASVSHYISSGIKNPALLCWAGAFDGTVFNDTVVSAFTYGGQNFTAIKSLTDATHTLEFYYLPNPLRGTNTISITRGGVATSDYTFCWTLANASQSTTPDGTGQSVSDVNSPFQVDVTASGGAMTFSVIYTAANVISSRLASMFNLGSATNDFWWGSYMLPVGAGTVSHIYTGGAADTGNLIAVSIGEAAATVDQIFQKPVNSILTNTTLTGGTLTQ